MTKQALIICAIITFMSSSSASSSCFQFLFPRRCNNDALPPLIAAYHEPPPHNYKHSNLHGASTSTATINSDCNISCYYSTNPSIFGKILNGSIPSRIYIESTDLLAFHDISPRAPLHALVIPKRYVPNVSSLRGNSNNGNYNKDDDDECDQNDDNEDHNDIRLIQDMKQMGLSLIQKHHPMAYKTDDYILCFHIPPFNSVNHLHLHVLAPASEMAWFYREIKYKCNNGGTLWCTSVFDVIDRLEAGLSAV
jgi:diadenosine tetraphosphate (Ap4A) HIT family hydrolase